MLKRWYWLSDTADHPSGTRPFPLPPPTKASTPTSTHPRCTPHHTLYSNSCAMLLIVSFRFPAASDPGYWPTSRDICKLKKKSHNCVSVSSGTATGTVGVVTYDIDDTDYKVAVMWSTPFDFNIYDVYFNVKVSTWSHTRMGRALLCYDLISSCLISCWSDFMLIWFHVDTLQNYITCIETIALYCICGDTAYITKFHRFGNICIPRMFYDRIIPNLLKYVLFYFKSN